MDNLVELKNVTKIFPIEKGMFLTQGSVMAVAEVSFAIGAGEIVSLVGESGSGKSTIGKMIQGLLFPTKGEIFFEGKNMIDISRKERAHLVQTIFQDPFQSLNPKLSVGFILKEALRHSSVRGEGSLSEIEQLLEATGLPKEILNDYPHQFSGGQKQRIGIARSLAMQPKLIVADEPVSALDLTIQSQILDLLLSINRRYGTAILLITHDLAVVEYCSRRVLVVARGRIVEESSVEELFKNPKENYTKTLLSSMLTL